jgi:hypothetical protein
MRDNQSIGGFMKRHISRYATMVLFLIIFLIISSCNLPLGGSGTDTSGQVAQTLVSLGLTQTAMAVPPAVQETLPPATEAAVTTPLTPPENTAAPITHIVMPGNMQTTESTIDDIVFNSDSFNTNLYERPYTSIQMVYRPDLDLQKPFLSTDNTFFYFALPVKNLNPDTKTLSGNYGAEVDIDRDGRGDFLVWAWNPPTASWDMSGVSVFTDQNNDVGAARPLLSDAPNKGDGYETEIWPGKPMIDPDGAWARIDPNNPLTVQIAVKRSLLGNPASFLWSAWADDMVKAPTLCDYNDAFTPAEAGSPYTSSSNYPLDQLALVDNTCRGAWGFTPTGNEPGYCKKTVAPTTAATKKPLQPTTTSTKPVVIVTTEVPCGTVQVGAQVTDGSTWDPSWASAVTLCVNGDCKNPDGLGYATWVLPAGGYTIIASSSFGITPGSASVKLGCGQKSLTQFVIGPG